MRGIEADALSASYAEGVRDGRRQAREELSNTVKVRGEAVDIATFDPAAAEKERSPDPLLVQAREALGRYDKILATIHYTHPHLGWSDEDGEFIRTVFAALDARLEVKQ
jgi:Zn-dependent protease with chaperone function